MSKFCIFLLILSFPLFANENTIEADSLSTSVEEESLPSGNIYDSLVSAIKNDDLEKFKLLANENTVDFNLEMEFWKKSLLEIGSCDGSIELLDFMISRGADLNKKNSYGENALHMAIFCGQIQKVELMVSKGVDIEEKSNFGRTPLDFAIYHKDIFEFLILKGAKNPKGLSPLTPEEIESEIEEARRELNDALGIGIDCSNGDSDC